jgi:hypothetical protein
MYKNIVERLTFFQIAHLSELIWQVYKCIFFLLSVNEKCVMKVYCLAKERLTCISSAVGLQYIAPLFRLFFLLYPFNTEVMTNKFNLRMLVALKILDGLFT